MPRRISLIIALILTFAFIAPLVPAQQRRRAPSRTNDASAQRREEARRRAQALSLVRETISDAGALDDLLYRARLLALAADVLWNADEREARLVFRRAWEAATAADRAAAQEELMGETNAGAMTTPSPPPVTETRDEILTMIARRDTSLTGEFLDVLTAERNDQTRAEPQPHTDDAWRTPSPRAARSLALAAQMLAEGQDRRVSEIIQRLVLTDGASGDLVAFLLRFRERNQAAADDLFLALAAQMRRANTPARATANDVLLLSSYIFSPQLLTIVDANGALRFRSIARAIVPGAQRLESAPPVAPAVRGAFYTFAAEALQRPLSAEEESERRARYFAIERLLPFFEREASSAAAALRAERDALSGGIDASRRAALVVQSGVNSFASDRVVDPLSAQSARLAGARDATERDRVRVGFIRIAARHKLWLRARDIAGEIEDASLKRAAASFVAAQQIAALSDAFAEDDTEDYERAAQFVSGAEISPVLRAYGLAQAARLAVRRNNLSRALELAVEAAQSARQATAGTPAHIAALVVVARTMREINRERAWEMLRETVRAINAAEDFAGDETQFDIGGQIPEAFADEEFPIESEAFRFDGIFTLAACDDFARATTEARLIEDARPRSFAKLAVARAMLDRAA